MNKFWKSNMTGVLTIAVIDQQEHIFTCVQDMLNID